jgi:hypothetical protein
VVAAKVNIRRLAEVVYRMKSKLWQKKKSAPSSSSSSSSTHKLNIK